VIDYKQLARRLEKDLNTYVHPNQVERYIENHPILKGAKYENVYRALYRHLLTYAQEAEPDRF